MSAFYPTYEILWAFVRGELDADTMRLVEDLLREDPELAWEVSEIRMLAERDPEGLRALKSHARQVDQALKAQGPANRLISPIWLATAAAVGLLILSVWLNIWPEKKSQPPESLMAWETASVLRSDPPDTALFIAMQLGVEGEWEVAAKRLQPLIPDRPDQPLIRLYLARAQIMAGDYEAGINLLDSLANDPDLTNVMQLDAKWYRALGKLMEGECEAAKLDFETISAQVGKARNQQIANLIQHCM